MTKDELKLVRDALKWCHGGEPCGTAEAIAVVEKALAQPEQTTPPQRTWVGLTEEEIETIWRKVEAGDFHDCVLPFAEKLEAKLKELNT